MFVQDVGDGPVVVLVPGLGADHTMYEPQVQALTEFRRIAVDLPGCGASGSLRGIPDDQVLDVQADALAQALTERGIERAHFVGVSYGGVVVQVVMLRHPDLVASAIICDSFCDTTPENLTGRLQLAGAKAMPLLLRVLPRPWLKAMNRPIYAKRWPAAYAMLSRLFDTADRDDLATQRRVANDVHLEERLRGTAIPTLGLVGDFGGSLALEMMRRIQRVIPGMEVHVIPDSFDPSNLCRPELFTAEVRAWVTARESRPGAE